MRASKLIECKTWNEKLASTERLHRCVDFRPCSMFRSCPCRSISADPSLFLFDPFRLRSFESIGVTVLFVQPIKCDSVSFEMRSCQSRKNHSLPRCGDSNPVNCDESCNRITSGNRSALQPLSIISCISDVVWFESDCACS